MGVSLPGLPKVGEGELNLFSHYTKPYGLKNTPYKVVDALGKTVEGTLDDSGKAVATGLAMGAVKVFIGDDPADTWDMDASHIGEPQWPTHELKEIADVGAFSLKDSPLSSLSAAAKAAQDKAMQVAEGIGQSLQQVGQLAPKVSSLNSFMPTGGDLGKLEGLGNIGNFENIGNLGEQLRSLGTLKDQLGNLGDLENPGDVASRIIGINGPISGSLSGASNVGGVVVHGIAGNVTLPGSLPAPSIPSVNIAEYLKPLF
ncbi:hypothetical protein AGMMS49545_22830 [Betaproteobacteria bacterium]|nr:hypothetical protein AGMMS49545_22830 [Betaproteobacteria bacterium]